MFYHGSYGLLDSTLFSTFCEFVCALDARYRLAGRWLLLPSSRLAPPSGWAFARFLARPECARGWAHSRVCEEAIANSTMPVCAGVLLCRHAEMNVVVIDWPRIAIAGFCQVIARNGTTLPVWVWEPLHRWLVRARLLVALVGAGLFAGCGPRLAQRPSNNALCSVSARIRRGSSLCSAWGTLCLPKSGFANPVR